MNFYSPAFNKMNEAKRVNDGIDELCKLTTQMDKEVAIIAALLNVKDNGEGMLPLLIKIKEKLSKDNIR